MAQIDIKQATIKFKDGGSNELEINVGEGTVSWTERRNIEYTLNRGVLDEVKKGDEVPCEVRFDIIWEYLKGPSASSDATAGAPTPEDCLKNRGGAVEWVSSDSDACRPFAIDIEIHYDPTCGTGDEEIITLADFRWEQIDHDLRAGTLSVTGRCNIEEPTINRVLNS
jgi:hypothetical protein